MTVGNRNAGGVLLMNTPAGGAIFCVWEALGRGCQQENRTGMTFAATVRIVIFANFL